MDCIVKKELNTIFDVNCSACKNGICNNPDKKDNNYPCIYFDYEYPF